MSMVVALSSMFAEQAQASTITFNLNYVYTGHLPNSSPQYLNATFRDGADCTAQAGAGGDCAIGTVELALSSSLENGDEFFTNFFFSTSNNTAVTTTYTALLAGGIGDDPTVLPYLADGRAAAGNGGNYDVRIDFDQAPTGDRFNDLDSLLFTITGSAITASTFNVAAPGTPAGTTYYAAAHLQGITSTQRTCSAWVVDANGANSNTGAGSANDGSCTATVPDSGSTLALLGVAMMGLGYLRSRLI
jgi:hypothetical protein